MAVRPDTDHIPLSLYVHIPWCVRKCPYCDFNSHQSPATLPEAAYVRALLDDLEQDLDAVRGRSIRSVFFGGGTPSLFSAQAIGGFLEQAARLVRFADDVEITLEANPGTAEAARFTAYREAGVNRLSLGVQSLDDGKLVALGRIHGRAEAVAAVAMARAAGFDNLNLDLMYALPGQRLGEAETDLRALLDLAPEHVSWYQLTLEPNTLFYQRPPPLPDDDLVGDMMEMGLEILAAHGYRQYEVSAHARPGRACRHNLNYWTFGDYLGIGAGAHAKLTGIDGRIRRITRQRHPERYLAGTPRVSAARQLSDQELPIEFMLNALRLNAGVPAALFQRRTGLSPSTIADRVADARAQGLLVDDPDKLQPSDLGRRFLNNLLMMFEPDGCETAG